MLMLPIYAFSLLRLPLLFTLSTFLRLIDA